MAEQGRNGAQGRCSRLEPVHAVITVTGTVQGVGFRPFVYRLATSLGLSGFVRNQGGAVYIDVTGDRAGVEKLVSGIKFNPPPLASIEDLSVRYDSVTVPESAGASGEFGASRGSRFMVLESSGENDAVDGFTGPGIPPDVATCSRCRAELMDPKDRRYMYPFINCTDCGPRFTIVTAAPYDRVRTSMRGFLMCPRCQEEYLDPRSRRFHAEPNACPECGPHLAWEWPADAEVKSNEPSVTKNVADRESLRLARQVLAAGGIVAVKGIGGFHLACDATNSEAVSRLRTRKNRPGKPLAVMVRDLETVRRWFWVSPLEEELLTSREAPIVILRRKSSCPVAPNVAPGLEHVGVMLPYSPVHLLLFGPDPRSESGPVCAADHSFSGDGSLKALVMTSGNRSGEPLVFVDAEARRDLKSVADGFLMHDREIIRPCDDSVVRVTSCGTLFIRRSRGWVPRVLDVRKIVKSGSLRKVFAAGADGKNVVAFLSGTKVLLSQHIGDIYSQESLSRYLFVVKDLATLYGFEPDVVAVDMHPGYEVSRAALEMFPGKNVVEVQHHHAHMCSVLAEHGIDETCIGVIFDGTGFGIDGKVWGGEILVGDCRSFRRAYHLDYVAMPGGEKAVQEPWRMALAYLKKIYGDQGLDLAAKLMPEVSGKAKRLWPALDHPEYPWTSSAGRLFDAAAALAGVGTVNTYDGESASLLGELAASYQRHQDHRSGVRKRQIYPGSGAGSSSGAIDVSSLVRMVVDEILSGSPKDRVAYLFHEGLAELVVEYAGAAASECGARHIVLSGGVFQNPLFLELISGRLTAEGYRVVTAHLVPPNDGGISLGQAVVAANLINERQ